MKKISIALFAATAIFFSSCGGGAKSEKPSDVAATQTEQQSENTSESTSSASGDFLTKYEEVVNKAIPLAEKVKAGDAAAIQEYTSLAQELSQFTQDNQTAISALSPADAQKYTELSQKFADAFK